MEELVEITDFIGDTYMINTKASDPRNYILSQIYSKISEILKTGIYVYSRTSFFYIGSVVSQYFHSGERTAGFSSYVPGIIKDQMDITYIVVVANNYLVYFISSFAVILFDYFIVIIFVNIPMAAATASQQIEEKRKILVKAKFKGVFDEYVILSSKVFICRFIHIFDTLKVRIVFI